MLLNGLSDNSEHEQQQLPVSKSGHSSQDAILIKISNLLDLSCPIHEKDNFIKVCVLYCVVLLNSVFFLSLFVSI